MTRDTIIYVNDLEQQMINLKAKVIGYDAETHMIFFKIVATGFEGQTLYCTHIKNCKQATH